MAIPVALWYQHFTTKERLSDSSTLRSSFLDAVNSALLTLNSRCFHELDEIESVDSGSIDLDTTYKPILNTMLRYFLQENGQWTKEPDPRLEIKFEKAIGDARSLWWGDTPPWAGAHAGSADDGE